MLHPIHKHFICQKAFWGSFLLLFNLQVRRLRVCCVFSAACGPELCLKSEFHPISRAFAAAVKRRHNGSGRYKIDALLRNILAKSIVLDRPGEIVNPLTNEFHFCTSQGPVVSIQSSRVTSQVSASASLLISTRIYRAAVLQCCTFMRQQPCSVITHRCRC